MPASLQTVTNITKEIYQGKIRNQLQDEAVGFKRIEKTSEGVESQVGGKYVTFPLRVRRNHGIGYRGEFQTLPAAGQQGYASVRIGLKYGYGRVRLSGQVMELVDSNYQAFASALDQEMTGIKNDIAKDTNRLFYGDGKGTLATVSAAGTTVNTVTVANTKYLELDMQVDVVNGSNGTAAASNRKITAINQSTKVVTLDGNPFSSATTDILVRTGNYNQEPIGLAAHVSNAAGAHQQLDGSVEPTWNAIVDANGGTNRALSEGLMILNTDKVRVNGGKTSLLLTSLGVRRAYFNLLSQARRYTNIKEFAGGFTGLAFNNGREIPVIEDIDCPDSTMWGLDEDTFKIYRDKDWSWMDRDNSTWKWVHDVDAYEAILHQYWEIGINRRNANFVIRDITEG